jgi:hypothetical protein
VLTAKAAFRSLLVVGLIPFILLGLLVSVGKAYGLMRYDPAYFTETYQERYDTPGAVAKALESALQTGDRALLAELQALRWPSSLESGPAITWVQLWERTDRYVTYLYYDVSANTPYLYHMEEARGRWVVSPSDVYHFVESGAYKRWFLTFSLVWWASGIVMMGLVYLSLASERHGSV